MSEKNASPPDAASNNQKEYEELMGTRTLDKLLEESVNRKTLQEPGDPKHDYSDKYYLRSNNPRPHDDQTIKRNIIDRFYNSSFLGEKKLLPPDENTPLPEVQKRLKFTKEELLALYRGFFHEKAGWESMFEAYSMRLYEMLLPKCTYMRGENRLFMSGGTPIMRDTVKAWVEYILTFEEGSIDMVRFDEVINSVHNNGVFAPHFIECSGDNGIDRELDAMQFLRELGDIKKIA